MLKPAYRSKLSLSWRYRAVELAILAGLLSQAGWGAPQARADSPDATTSSSAYQEAEQLRKAHKWADAVVVLRGLLRKEPVQPRLAIELSEALMNSGRREDALAVLSDAASREHGARREALLRRARVVSRLFETNAGFQIYQDGLNLAEAGKYRPAREKFEKALSAEPENAEILLRIGQCLVLEGDFDSAAEKLKLARRLDPAEPEVHLWLGRSLQQRGEIDEALEELKAAARDLPESELAPVWYAEALFTAGQRAAAFQYLETDLDRRPFHLRSLLELAQLRVDASGEHSSSAHTRTDVEKSKDLIIGARKDLQLALSRLSAYASAEPEAPSELNLWKRESPDDVRAEVEKLLKRIDSRIEELSGKES